MALQKTNHFLGIILVSACLLLFIHIYRSDIQDYRAPVPSYRVSHPSKSTNAKQYRIIAKTLTLDDGEVVYYNVYPKMNEESQEIRLVSNSCISSSRVDNHLASTDTTGIFTIVTNVLLFQHGNKQNYYFGNGHNVSDEMITARDWEIIGVLARNLQHPLVDEIHILVEKPITAKFIQHLWLPNSHKIVIRIMPNGTTVKNSLEYVAECLIDRLVAISNQDNVFGKGWEKINLNVLKNERLMYALTRHTSNTLQCSGSLGLPHCDPGYNYVGCHDTFFFYVHKFLGQGVFLSFPNMTPNQAGFENIFLWFFKHKLNYRLLNPCVVLFVHHEHCVSIRERGRKRINTAKTTEFAPFTSNLH